MRVARKMTYLSDACRTQKVETYAVIPVRKNDYAHPHNTSSRAESRDLWFIELQDLLHRSIDDARNRSLP